MKPTSKYSFCIASDDEHEKVFAEINYGDKFVALISQEEGPNKLKIEFAGSGFDQKKD